MPSEIRVIGQPNPDVLRAILESVLNYLAVQLDQPGQPVELVPVEISTLETA